MKTEICERQHLETRYDIKHGMKEVDEVYSETPSPLPTGSPSFGTMIILDSPSPGSDILFSH
jgi:hypothetical protein